MNIRLIATGDEPTSITDIVAAVLVESIAGFLSGRRSLARPKLYIVWSVFHGG